MNYIKIACVVAPNESFVTDTLSAFLGEVGFDSFESTSYGVDAYCPENLYSDDAVQSVIQNFPFEAKISVKKDFIEDKNWNEEWEKNYFAPIVIEDKCVIHSTFHKDIPNAEYEIIIDPKMSFGTGYHTTTRLMISHILNIDLDGKSVLDMGCGTGVLAILAQKRGAKKVIGIDIDSWAYANAIENLKINKAYGIEIREGGAELLTEEHFDVIFANINRNILLNDMAAYAKCLSVGGELFMSGFYKEDIPVIEKKANELGLTLLSFTEDNNWVAVRTQKQR